MSLKDVCVTMVGNMQVNELSLFLRFITEEASVCIVPKIKV